MRIFDTSNLRPTDKLSADEASWIYNGLDCCVTLEVRDKLREQLTGDLPNIRETYETAMRKFAPVNYMNIRGLLVNEPARQYAISNYRKDLFLLQDRFDKLMEETVGYTINWRSTTQLKGLFYDTFLLKPVRKRNAKGEFAPTVNADALEKFCEYLYPQVYARLILSMRDLAKKLSFLETEIDPDGRMRTSLNIAGTDTGRFSSKFSVLGTGSNLQNVEDRLRAVFKPDPGKIFVNVDLEQADARNVGARIYEIFYDEFGPEKAGAYLDACESGDLHTQVTKMVWPNLSWTENLNEDKEIAEQKFYHEHSYRDMSKKIGHGTNFYATPQTASRHAKVEQFIIENFQRKYFTAFPLIGNYEKDLTRRDWHSWVYTQLKETSTLTNLFGRRRIFFDRYTAPETLRAAIAFDPQSSTGEELDRGWLQLWNAMPEAELMLPVHDSILFQLPYDRLNELLPRALELLKITITLKGGRRFHVPLEAATGWNWAKSRFNKKTGLWENAMGLRKWTGKEDREPPKNDRVRLSAVLGR